MFRKNLSCEIIKKDTEDPKVSFIASTENADRYGDIINQNGWDLSKYRSNNIVLFNHNASALPIGKGFVDVVENKLMVDIEFDMEDTQAAEIARKTKAGYLNAVSVGFNPIDATPRAMLEKSHPAHGTSGQYFDRAELLEISIVTIPANGEAVNAKNYTNNRWISGSLKSFISELKHIIDVDVQDDIVVVTYARKEADEEMEMEMEMDEELQEEEEEKDHYDDDDDKDKDKEKFLTTEERNFLSVFLTTDGEKDE